MLLYYLNDLLQVVIRILVVEQAVGEVFQGFKEAVEVHLVVVRPTDDVLVDDVVVGLQDVRVGQARVLGQPLELTACDEVVALLSSKDFKHLLSIRVEV